MIGVRSRAYCARFNDDGKWILPLEFENGVKVPKRFHAELEKVQP